VSDAGPAGPPGEVTVVPVEGVGEVVEGADLADLLAGSVSLRDGDVVVVTSKVVSKAEGRVRPGSREDHLASETRRVVARRGPTSIVRTRHGLVMAAAGIDDSNVEPGSVVLLPRDPDASARRLREDLALRTGRNVAVVVTDTAGRAWRTGQTDIAVGAAGLEVLSDHAGRTDPYGNLLAVTAPAVADEVAGAADLVKGKLAGRPAAVVRGLAPLVLQRGRHGPGAAALVRDEESDMFGLGAREAVLAALTGRPDGTQAAFGAPVAAESLADVLATLPGGHEVQVEVQVEVQFDGPAVQLRLSGEERGLGGAQARLLAAAYALGWRVGPDGGLAGDPGDLAEGALVLTFRARTP
jgi:coenzyme F420-0:L-glutamate ligase/coenzyme F420-1:gamma-L-glutamate ligase